MSFSQKTWKDRDVQYPGKRTLTNINDNSDFQDVIVERAEGTVTEAGDLFCATKMNDLEQRIADIIAELDTALQEEINHIYPIGAIYKSFNSTSPNILFPGTTWGALPKRALIAVPTNQPAMQNVGNNDFVLTFNQFSTKSVQVTGTTSKTALTIKQMPAHRHHLNSSLGKSGDNGTYPGINGPIFHDAVLDYEARQTGYTGNGYGHNHGVTGSGTFTEDPITIDIRQQYITMYAWRRTA